MNLENFKSTWKHFQAINSLPALENIESLIPPHKMKQSRQGRLSRIFVNLVLFIVITLFIQGG